MTAFDNVIHCAGCGRKSPWKPQYAGKRVRCKCGHIIEVRAAPVGEAEDDALQIVGDAPARLLQPKHVVQPGANASPVAKPAPRPPSATPVSTVEAPPNPFASPDESPAASDPFAPAASLGVGPFDVAGSHASTQAAASEDEDGGYGIAPMPAIPITRRPEPQYDPPEDGDDASDDLLPPMQPGAAVAAPALAGVGGPMLGYSGRRRQRDAEEQAQLTSYQRKEMVIPAILIAVGLLATFVQARVELGEFDLLSMSIYVAVATLINLVLIFIALLAAAKLMDLGLGEIGPALLKIAAVAILPSAIGGVIQASVGFVGGLLAWVITLALYFVLLMWLFEMDSQEMMITAVIIWFMRTWVAYFVIMAIFGLGGDDDDDALDTSGSGGNSQWVAPGDSSGEDDPDDPDMAPQTQPSPAPTDEGQPAPDKRDPDNNAEPPALIPQGDEADQASIWPGRGLLGRGLLAGVA